MADEVEMKPVDMKPVAAAEPPKVNPLAAKPAAPKSPIAAVRKPVPGGTAAALKPGVRLPPKAANPTASIKKNPTASLRPAPAVSTKTAPTVLMKTGTTPTVKLVPKTGATVALKPVIRKPGSTVSAAPLAKPVGVDSQGVAKLPTVEVKAVSREDVKATTVAEVKPLDALKTVTQKLKGVTQQIPQQAILRKTGIVSDMDATSPAQKEAAKHKTARISLSDAMGVSPVKESSAPMKTIRIKRPINLPSGATSQALSPQKRPEAPAAAAAAPAAPAAAPSTTVTQRKTLKITRPGTAVRPSGKFNLKKPAPANANQAAGAEGEIADIPEIPPMPVAEEKAGVMAVLALITQVAACLAMLALTWMLFENFSGK